MAFRIMVIFWMCIGVASADRQSPGFGGMRIVSGNVDFEGCLSQPGCASSFYRFLAQATLEQGFAMEGSAAGTQTTVQRRDGWIAGGLIHSFPFSGPRENLSGKEENTSFSPVFPKLYVGKMWTNGEKHYGLSGNFLPPVAVQGARALNLGMMGSVSKTLENGTTRAGVDVDVSFIRAAAPVTASEEQVASAETEGFDTNVDPSLVDERCDTETGCIDIFMVANVSVRGGVAWQWGEQWFPYAQVGLTLFDEWLRVDYDDSTWWGIGLQPTAHSGTGWSASEAILLTIGGSLGLKQPNQNPDEKLGAFYKVTGSASYRF